MQYHRPPIVPSDIWGSRKPHGKPSPGVLFRGLAVLLFITTVVLFIFIVGDLIFN